MIWTLQARMLVGSTRKRAEEGWRPEDNPGWFSDVIHLAFETGLDGLMC